MILKSTGAKPYLCTIYGIIQFGPKTDLALTLLRHNIHKLKFSFIHRDQIQQLNSSFNLTEIQSLFKTFDKNNDKYISGEELGKAMRFLGLNVTKKDVQEAMKVLDKNGMTSSIPNLHFLRYRQF